MKFVGSLWGCIVFVTVATAFDKDAYRENFQEEQLSYPSDYKIGKTYIYWYNTQILTGIPQTSNQYTGFRLLARVRMSFKENRIMHIQFDKIRLSKLNKVLPLEEPNVMLPLSFFESLDDKSVEDAMTRFLELPISFFWSNTGWVQKLKTHREDVDWSINVKKGLISMLNVNLRFKTDEVLQRNGQYIRTFYYEDGIDGHCSSMYSYLRFPYNLPGDNQRLLSMIRNRDISNCTARPWMDHALFLTDGCPQSRKPESAQTVSRYNLTKEGEKFFLRQMKTDSQYLYTPDRQRDGSIVTNVVQTLNFWRSLNSLKVKLRSSESLKHPRGLMMITPIPEMDIHKDDSKKRRAKASTAIKRMMKSHKKDEFKMYDHMRSFITEARRMSADDIKQVTETKMASDPMTRKMLLYIIPKIASLQVIQVIDKWIADQKFPDNETAILVSRLGGMSFVSTDEMVTTLMERVETMYHSNHQTQTYQALLLIVGQLIRTRYTAAVPNHRGGSSHPLLTVRRIRNFYRKLLTNPGKPVPRRVGRVFVFQSIGNCGLKRPCLNLLVPYLQPPNKMKRSLRVHVIYALSGMATIAPHRIRRLLFPIFLDTREDVEIRIEAYLCIMKTESTSSSLQQIAVAMQYEPVKQVRAFVMTHLEELAKAKDSRCYGKLALNASHILDQIPREEIGKQYSQIFQFSARLFATLIETPRSFLPRIADLRLFNRFAGIPIPTLSLGGRYDEAQKLLSGLFGPNGKLRVNEDLRRVLSPLSNTKSPLDINFMSVMRLFDGYVWLSGLSLEATEKLSKGSIPLQKSLYDLIISGGTTGTQMSSTFYVDKISTRATAAGIPVSLNYTIGAHIGFTADVKVKPNLLSKISKLDLTLKARGSARAQIRAGVDLTLIRSFVETSSAIGVPLNELSTKIGWNKTGPIISQYRVNIQRPNSDVLLMKSSNRIYSRVTIGRRAVKKEIPHRSLPKPRVYQKKLLQLPLLGLDLEQEYLGMNSTGMRLPSLPFYGPVKYQLRIKRSSDIGKNRPIDVLIGEGMYSENGETLITRLKERKSLDQEKLKKSIDVNESYFSGELILQIRLREWNEKMSERPIYHMFGSITTSSFLPGYLYFAGVEKLRGKEWTKSLHGYLKCSPSIRKPKFDPEQPLQFIEDAFIANTLLIFENDVVQLDMETKAVNGEFWRETIKRIMNNPNKRLPNFPDIQKCQKDLRSGNGDSPACYQAWKDINSINRDTTIITVNKKAPFWMQKIPLFVYNGMQTLFGNNLIKSNYTTTSRTKSWGSGESAVIDSQISPYAHSVFTSYLSAMNTWQEFLNAKLPIAGGYSFINTAKEDLLNKMFTKLYPSRCEVISKADRIKVRTFDHFDIQGQTKLDRESGRIVLVQDIQNRLLVTEERSDNHRITYIRLAGKKHHVMIATNEAGLTPTAPIVYYNGKQQEIPFVIKNRRKQTLLRAMREPTPRSGQSITVDLPHAGVSIRTHPLVATEIQLNPFFQNEIRGICGNMDGEIRDEMKGPECKMVYRNPQQFINRYRKLLKTRPSLKEIETSPDMTQFMSLKQCPDQRSYPLLI